MFYLIDGEAIAARWRSLPPNWRDPETGAIYSRLPVDHPRVRVGVKAQAPAVVPPFQRLREEDGVYDPQADTVTEGYAVETLPLEQARRKARDIVNAERDRKVALGFDYPVEGLTVRAQTRDGDDFANIANLVQVAQSRMSRGAMASLLRFRGADDAVVDLTPSQVVDLGLAAAAHRMAAYQWSWPIKDAIEEATSVDELISAMRSAGLLNA